eukprot:SAG11_NODE_1007_length_6206_cov_36.144752_1_plen_86_part_00
MCDTRLQAYPGDHANIFGGPGLKDRVGPGPRTVLYCVGWASAGAEVRVSDSEPRPYAVPGYLGTAVLCIASTAPYAVVDQVPFEY